MNFEDMVEKASQEFGGLVHRYWEDCEDWEKEAVRSKMSDALSTILEVNHG